MAITNFKRTISVGNFSHKDGIGQIATFLILIMVVVLIFVLIAVNIGKLSQNATQTANAADSAALLLGSLLSSRAGFLRESLRQIPLDDPSANASFDEPSKTRGCPWPRTCAASGALKWGIPIVIAALVILIGLIILIFNPPAALAWFIWWAHAGFPLLLGLEITGSFIGSRLDSAWRGGTEGWLKSAAEGILIGTICAVMAKAMMSNIIEIYKAVELLKTVSGLKNLAQLGDLLIPSDPGGLTFQKLLYGTNFQNFFKSALGQVLGRLFGQALLLTASGWGAGQIYANQVAPPDLGPKGFATQSIYAAIQKRLQGLDAVDQIAWAVSSRAFFDLVDDPRKEPDEHDLDGDYDTTELVPAFANWYVEKLDVLHAVADEITPYVNSFIESANDFKDYFKVQFPEGGYLHRPENGANKDTGYLVWIARDIEIRTRRNGDYKDVGYWKTGKPAPDRPNYHDELDLVSEKIKELFNIIDGLNEENPLGRAANWRDWLPFFLDKNDPGSPWEYGDYLYNLAHGAPYIAGLANWEGQLETIRRSLPVCTYSGSPVPEELPCKDNQLPPYGDGHVDEEQDPDFQRAYRMIRELVDKMDTLHNAAKALYDRIKDLYDSNGLPLDGEREMWYPWADSAGEHRIGVRISNFRLPLLKTEWWSKLRFLGTTWLREDCLFLDNYYDESGSDTWVEVIRMDEAKRELGMIGKWNSYANVEEGGRSWLKITRKAKAAYHLYVPDATKFELSPYVRLTN